MAASVRALLVLAGAVLVAAPALSASNRLDALTPQAPEPEVFPDLSGYHVLTVTDLDVRTPEGNKHGDEVSRDLADDIADVMRAREVPGLEVRRGAPLGAPDEMVLTGAVVTARAGNRAARYFVGPLAAARVIADFRVLDASTGRELQSGRVKKSWGMAGIAGVTQGLPSVVHRTSERVARWFVEARAAHDPSRVPAPVAVARVSRR
jgi:hypothetical protein